MMTNDIGRNSPPPSANFVAAASADTHSKEREALRNQAAALAEILRGGKDVVEISDKARALANSPRDTTPVTRSSAVAVAESLGTREGRENTAEKYNAVLEDLRSQYGEEGAMRRFDAFMESEGYERVTEESYGVRPSGGLSAAGRVNGASMWMGDGDHPNIWSQEQSTANLRTNSSIKADIVDGEVKYVASTHAGYGAFVNQDVYDALDGLRQKNLESAQRGVSFDLNAYMQEHFGADPQTSVVSASTELGTVAANLLKKAGVDLGAEGKVEFTLKGDGSGLVVNGAFEDSAAVQEAVDAALRKNPDMLQAFKDEYSCVALSDAGALGGAYNDGVRSVSYADAWRSFTYSAKEPSAVVMTDFVRVSVDGYNYQKKVSDSFDVNADSTYVVGGGQSISDPEYDHQRINAELEERVSQALESGETIDSTMTQSEYDSVRKARGGAVGNASGIFNLGGGDPNAKIYFSGGATSIEDSIERENRATATRQALSDLAADPQTAATEISYVDEKREKQKATVSKLLELFASGRKAPSFEMIASIMEALRLTR